MAPAADGLRTETSAASTATPPETPTIQIAPGRKLALTPDNIAALLTAFKYRTGVDLTTTRVSPHAAWLAYKNKQHSWIGKPRTKRRYGDF